VLYCNSHSISPNFYETSETTYINNAYRTNYIVVCFANWEKNDRETKIDDKVMETRDPMKVIDPLWWTVSIYDSKEKYEKDLKSFSFHQRAVFALMWYMAEVNNGGHSQFYSNSTGIVWEDAMDGFELIGPGRKRDY
jgi:hypothetical protein